jgi:hypothetical protein
LNTVCSTPDDHEVQPAAPPALEVTPHDVAVSPRLQLHVDGGTIPAASTWLTRLATDGVGAGVAAGAGVAGGAGAATDVAGVDEAGAGGIGAGLVLGTAIVGVTKRVGMTFAREAAGWAAAIGTVTARPATNAVASRGAQNQRRRTRRGEKPPSPRSGDAGRRSRRAARLSGLVPWGSFATSTMC